MNQVSSSLKHRLIAIIAVTFVYVISLFIFFPAPSKVALTLKADPDKVIMTLPLKDPGMLLRLASKPEQTNQYQEAMRSATVAYDAFASSGNARYLDIAEQLVAKWPENKQVPESVWLLRSRIKQAKHQFREAASELEELLKLHQNNANAKLLAADAWRRAGELDKAQKHCLSLATDGFVIESALCQCEIALNRGDMSSAQRLLDFIETRSTLAGNQIFQWFIILKSDLFRIQSKPDAALEAWTRIKDWSALPYAYKLNLADLLIEHGLYTKMLDLLRQERPTLAVLLRRNRALNISQIQQEASKVALKNRVKILEQSPDKNVHLYERALYASWYEKDDQKALRLGLENWHQQKSHEDAELVFYLAKMAQDEAAEKLIKQWQANW